MSYPTAANENARSLTDANVQDLIEWSISTLASVTPVGLHHAVTVILQKVVVLLEADAATLLVYDPSIDTLTMTVNAQNPSRTHDSIDLAVEFSLKLAPLPWLNAVLNADGYVGKSSDIPHREEREILTNAGVQTLAFVPVTAQGKLAGMLYVGSLVPHQWFERTTWLLQLLAATLAESLVPHHYDHDLASTLSETWGDHSGILTVAYDPETRLVVYASPSFLERIPIDPVQFHSEARSILEPFHLADLAAVSAAMVAIAARAQRYRYAPVLAEPVSLRARAYVLNVEQQSLELVFLDLKFTLINAPDGPLVVLVACILDGYATGINSSEHINDEVLTGFVPSFVESSATIVSLYDPFQDERLYISAAYERITGRSAAAWRRGKDRMLWASQGEELEQEQIRQYLVEALDAIAIGQIKATDPFYQGEHKLLVADWSERTFAVSLFGVQYDGRWVVGILASDVTDERQLQTERDAALIVATEALATRDRFIARLSASTIGPVNSMLGWILLARDGATPKAQLRLQRAKHDGLRIVSVLADALELGRLQSEESPEVGPINLTEIIAEVVDRLSLVAGEARVAIMVTGQGSEHIALGAPDRVISIIGELLSNAVKFSPPNGTIEISSHTEGDWSTLVVRDHGPGVPTNLVERIFDPFERENGNPASGIGLGLSVAHALATSIGGELTLDTREPGGARFVLTLRRFPSDGLGLQAAPLQDKIHRILCIEDDPGSRALLAEILGSDSQMQVEVVATLKEAMELTAVTHFDLILTDLYLPDAQGVEVLEQITGNPLLATTPIVVMSADRRQQVVRAVTASGASAFLGKPLAFEKLAENLIRVLGHSAVERPRSI